jgi:uncharacterized membrane protein YkvA (DUF1232 family)
MPDMRNIIRNQNSGFFSNLILQGKLMWRLLGDRRVNFLLKLLPIAAAVYVISPVDLLPGAVIPFIGALDDAMVIWLGTTLFMSLCPDHVVQEHTRALENVVDGNWQESRPENVEKVQGEIIDAEAVEEK